MTLPLASATLNSRGLRIHTSGMNQVRLHLGSEYISCFGRLSGLIEESVIAKMIWGVGLCGEGGQKRTRAKKRICSLGLIDAFCRVVRVYA